MPYTIMVSMVLIFGLFIANIIQSNNRYNSTVAYYEREIDTYQSNIIGLSNIIDTMQYKEDMNLLQLIAGRYMMTRHNSKVKITDDTLYSLLKSINAWYPEIIMAQVKIESNYGNSDVGRNANNVIGMKRAKQRITTQIKDTDYKGYGKYDNWELCVIDKVIWDYTMFKHKPTRQEYLRFMNRKYAEASNYDIIVNKVSKRFR